MRAILLLPLLLALDAAAQVAIVSRSSYVREGPNTATPDCFHAQEGDTLVLVDADDHAGYYHVRAPGNCTGYVYRNRVRLRNTDLPAWAHGTAPPAPNSGSTPATGTPRFLNACSFNIKFIGQGDSKLYQPLVDLLRSYDLVVVQELVSAPVDKTSGGVQLSSTWQARTFFSLMQAEGFDYALSDEKTGRTRNDRNGSTCEYFVSFFKPGVLMHDADRSAFIDSPLAGNSTFDRVPWTSHFTTTDGTLDFSIINVHLSEGTGSADAAKRARELDRIFDHISAAGERDQFIVGDMNFTKCEEVQAILPAGFSSLNATCQPTNTLPTGPKPFDHVIYRNATTAGDVDRMFGFRPLNLVALMEANWDPDDGPYPGDPYDHNAFINCFSDHKPVEFRLIYGVRDDD